MVSVGPWPGERRPVPETSWVGGRVVWASRGTWLSFQRAPLCEAGRLEAEPRTACLHPGLPQERGLLGAARG